MVSEIEGLLRSAANRVDADCHPFTRSIRDGVYPRSGLQFYAADLAVTVSAFSRSLAAIFASCDDPEVRRMLLENLLEEEGATSFCPKDGLVVDSKRRHSDLAWRFARATGATGDISHLTLIPGWFRRQLNAGNWLGPLAYVVIGYEANIPPTFRILLDGFRQHYGFTEEELTFFTEHTVADERHSAHGAKVISNAATTPELRRQALNGARRGASAWWQFHLHHHRALSSRNS